MAKPTPLITPGAGGRLMVGGSDDNVGILHYLEKVNFRRKGDEEARREGWAQFRPNTGLPLAAQSTLGVGKLMLLAENVRPNSDRCVIAATQTAIYRFTYSTGAWTVIGSGFSALGKRWQTVTIDGYIVFNNTVDLPVSYRVEDATVTPIYELREVGIASVGWITEYNGFLMCMNIVEIKEAELAGVMNGLSPYGLVNVALCNHIPYRVLWSEFAQPRNFAPVFEVVMGAASATITLPFPSSVFVAGVTRVAVVNGGPDGGLLGGDTANPEGILVSTVVGNVVTLAVTTNVSLTYPRTVGLTRWSDISKISGYKDLQDDSSHITCGKKLGMTLVIYRTRGVWVGRYTATAANPFDFKERHETTNVPKWPHAIVSVNSEYHLYPGKGDDGGAFYMFDGVNMPYPQKELCECAEVLFDGLTAASDVWAVDNSMTKEVWFCRPSRTLCFDYIKRTCSVLDAEVDSAALVSRPGWDDDWFILSIAGVVYTYGLINEQVTTWLRNGVNPGGKLKWGKYAFGDTFSEKTTRSYLLHLGSSSIAVPLRVRILGSDTASATQATLVDETIANPAADGGMIPMHYLAIYFQDEVSIATATAVDADVRFVGRLLEWNRRKSLGNARNA